MNLLDTAITVDAKRQLQESILGAAKEQHYWATTSVPFVRQCVKCGALINSYRIRCGLEEIPPCIDKKSIVHSKSH